LSLLFYDSKKSEDAIKVIVTVIFDLNGTFFFTVVELHAGREAMGEEVLNSYEGWCDVGCSLVAATCGSASRFGMLLGGHFFSSSHREAVAENLVREPLLLILIFERK
jgi:hypothetical protein